MPVLIDLESSVCLTRSPRLHQRHRLGVPPGICVSRGQCRLIIINSSCLRRGRASQYSLVIIRSMPSKDSTETGFSRIIAK